MLPQPWKYPLYAPETQTKSIVGAAAETDIAESSELMRSASLPEAKNMSTNARSPIAANTAKAR